jgi:prepilin-type N-terminal cleavage/methylation domain-containing protein
LTTGRSDNHEQRRPWLRQRCGPRRGAGGGFTLLELIVVLGLIGVLLGLAAPSLRGFFASRQTADAAAQVLALTQLAGSRAAAQGSVYRLNVDSQTGTYWLTVQQEGEFVDLGCEFGRRFQLPEGTTVCVQSPWGSDPLSYIEFYPSGRTEEALIELEDRRGEVYQIVCESVTEAFHIVSPPEVQRQ